MFNLAFNDVTKALLLRIPQKTNSMKKEFITPLASPATFIFHQYWASLAVLDVISSCWIVIPELIIPSTCSYKNVG